MPKQDAPPTFDQTIATLRAAGFGVDRKGSLARVTKNHCATLLELMPDGGIRFTEGPGYVLNGSIAGLEDRGFQKYLVSGGRAVPALAEHLTQVHQFSEEMKAALGIPSLYNEALGTVSQRYLYDRVHGRERKEKHRHKAEAPH